MIEEKSPIRITENTLYPDGNRPTLELKGYLHCTYVQTDVTFQRKITSPQEYFSNVYYDGMPFQIYKKNNMPTENILNLVLRAPIQ